MRLETSSIKELANAHRMGHTCASLNGDLLFIWGGSDESVACLPVKNNHLWIYDTLSGYWRHRLCTGECPPYLSGATSSLIGQRMFVFGGHSTAQDNWLNSLYCLDLDTFCWQDLGAKAEAQPTKPIRADKLVSWSYGGRMFVFGGYGWSQTEHLLELLDLQRDLQLAPDHRWPKFGWNNQLVEFNQRDNTWRWPSYSGKCPSARAAHSGALMGETYYLFGGRDSRERLNDLYALDMRTLTWTQIADFSSSLPIDRPPMRHLLEPPAQEEQGGLNEREGIDPLVLVESGDDRVNIMNEDEELIGSEDGEEEEEDLMMPSPSSSSQQQQQCVRIRAPNDMDDEVAGDSEDGEEPDYPFDFSAHPNHLLERWSLSSSHPSTSDCANLSDLQSRLQHCDSSSTCLSHEQQMEAQHQQNSPATTASGVDLPDQDDRESPEEEVVNLDNYPTTTTPSIREIPKPAGRSFASFTPISERQVLLYGGISSLDENLDDCWIFDIATRQWTQINLKNKCPRLWHTGATTKNNEVVIIGGSCSDKIDEICTDILTISLTPKSLKRLALDAAARSIRMRTVNRAKGLPSTVSKLIRLRKQAISLSSRRFYTRPPAEPLINQQQQYLNQPQ